jgi:hypothetical protein
VNDPKFPDVRVKLSGHDSNAGAIMGTVARALKRGGATREQVDEYRTESMSGDYDNLLQTAFRWVEVE